VIAALPIPALIVVQAPDDDTCGDAKFIGKSSDIGLRMESREAMGVAWRNQEVGCKLVSLPLE